MSPFARGDSSTLTLDGAQQLDALCDEFEFAWKADTAARPRIEDYVVRVEPELQEAAILELLPIEIAYLRRRHVPLSLAEYNVRYPSAVSELPRWFENGEHSEPSAARHLSAGDHFGKYTILAFLGAGGMGEVYRAFDTTLAREVAIKILLRRHRWSSEAIARISVEAKALAALKHPHIITVYEFAQHNDVTFMALELLEGETLAQRLSRGPLAPAELAKTACQLASALAMAHERKIVHRDLKPQNIFLTSDGDVKVLDFGLTRLLETSPGDPAIDGASCTTGPTTAHGARMGTTGYMSPEQIRGEAIDARSDVFALGCVLSEMVYGQSPFRRETVVETDQAIQVEPYVRPTSHRSGLESRLHHVAARCLQKSPYARYSSAVDVYAEVTRIQQEQLGRKGQRAKRVERFVLFAAVLVVLLLGGLVARAYQVNLQQEQLKVEFEKIVDKVTPHLDRDQLKQSVRELVLLEQRLGTTLHVNSIIYEKRENKWEVDWVQGYLSLERGKEADIRDAIQFFESANVRNGEFAPAYIGLAECYYRLSNAYIPPNVAMRKVTDHAEHARQMQPGDAMPLVLLALYKHRYEWDWSGAKSDFEEALDNLRQQERDSAMAHAMYGNSLVLQREFDEGIEQLERALELDPKSPQLPVDLALAHLYRGSPADIQQAEQILRNLLAQNTNNYPALWALGEVYLQKRMFSQAIAELRKAQELEKSPEVLAELAYCLGKEGRPKDAQRVIDELEKMSKSQHVPSTAKAVARLGLGEEHIDEALKLLHAGVNEHDEWLVWLEVDAVFADLRNTRKEDLAKLREKMKQVGKLP